MKIIILVDHLPFSDNAAGGLQNYTLRIARSLYEKGEDVLVLCRAKVQAGLFDFPVRDYHVSFRRKTILKALQAITFHLIDNSLTILFDAWEVRRECHNFPNVDIIHSPNYKCLGLFVNHRKMKLIVRASSFHPIWTAEVQNTLDNRMVSCLEKRLYKRADHVFAPSRHLAGILENKLCRNVDVLPTLIPDKDQAESPKWYNENLLGRKYILYFGTILKRKGLFILAEAMNKVWKENPNVLLVLAGPDLVVDGKSNYHRFLEIIGTNHDNVIYASNLSQEALIPLIRNSFFTVSPSIEDNCPNSMLEAMALGKIVLGTIGSSMEEFYPPSCQDLLVQRGDFQALAEKIIWLWDLSPQDISFYEQESKHFVEKNHSLDVAVNSLINYYRRVLAKN